MHTATPPQAATTSQAVITPDEATTSREAAAPAPKASSTRQSTTKTRRGASGSGAAVRILGADDNESEAEDAEWPTEERAAA